MQLFKRHQKANILKDLKEKMVFLTGPRQVGKTILSQNLLSPSDFFYLNWDDEEDRRILLDRSWKRNTKLVILDEIHKKPQWKSWVKGLYDKEKNNPPVLVTGSASLEIFRKQGDSLAGRYFLHRLYPFSISELVKNGESAKEASQQLLKTGGFPEPYLKKSEAFAKRWRRTHIDRIIREDLITLENVRNINQIELLVTLLSQRVGSQSSYASLGRDLSVSPHTVKNWISILEALYVIFTIYPYSKKLSRTIIKEPKIYFFDIGAIPSENLSAKVENLVALCLLKRQHYLEDVHGEKNQLFYIRDREKREVDFLTTRDGQPEFLIEVKTKKETLDPSLKYYFHKIPTVKPLQLVYFLKRPLSWGPISVQPLDQWLSQLEN